MAVVGIDPFDPNRLLKWEACRFPERPPDKMTEFDLGCPACIIKLQATIASPPPPGAFTGYWENREDIRQRLRAKGIL